MAKSTVRAESVRIRVAALSTSNLTLSGAQTVDSVACVAGDLVGALGQSNSKNGVYVVQSGAWLAVDPGFGTGLEVYARAGGSNANKVYGCDTTGAIDWGTTSTTFTLKSSSGAAFDPASPGTLGGTTPGTVNASSLYLTGSSVAAVATKVQVVETTSYTGAVLVGAGGQQRTLEADAASATMNVRNRVIAKQVANSGTYDVAISSKGGRIQVTAVGATGSSYATASFADNGATTFNGATYTGYSTTLSTPASINIAASGGNVRIENNSGSSVNFLIVVDQLIAV